MTLREKILIIATIQRLDGSYDPQDLALMDDAQLEAIINALLS